VFLGSFAALYQYKLKRLIAYSTISHVGFLLLGLSLNSFLGYVAVLFYLIVYVFIVLGFFLSIVLTRYASNFALLKTLEELRFLFKYNSLFVFLLSLVIFSNAGIPPLIGFFSKLFILASLVQAKMFAVLFFIILITVVSTVYYIRLIHMLFFSLASPLNAQFVEFTRLDSLLIFNIQALNIVIVFFPKLLFILIFNWVLFFY
jgi:NADH-quinone oxidoreductase subunit N